mgnify:CR=1 FL=1
MGYIRQIQFCKLTSLCQFGYMTCLWDPLSYARSTCTMQWHSLLIKPYFNFISSLHNPTSNLNITNNVSWNGNTCYWNITYDSISLEIGISWQNNGNCLSTEWKYLLSTIGLSSLKLIKCATLVNYVFRDELQFQPTD